MLSMGILFNEAGEVSHLFVGRALGTFLSFELGVVVNTVGIESEEAQSRPIITSLPGS